jgi:hypothetical protein
MVEIARAHCDLGSCDMTPLQQLPSIWKNAHTNLPSMDKGLNVMKAHRMMVVFANDSHCFCGCNPGMIHECASSLEEQ